MEVLLSGFAGFSCAWREDIFDLQDSKGPKLSGVEFCILVRFNWRLSHRSDCRKSHFQYNEFMKICLHIAILIFLFPLLSSANDSSTSECISMLSGTSDETPLKPLCTDAQEGFKDCVYESNSFLSRAESIKSCITATRAFGDCVSELKLKLTRKEAVTRCNKAQRGFLKCREFVRLNNVSDKNSEKCLSAKSGFAECSQQAQTIGGMNSEEIVNLCLKARSSGFSTCFGELSKVEKGKASITLCAEVSSKFNDCFPRYVTEFGARIAIEKCARAEKADTDDN